MFFLTAPTENDSVLIVRLFIVRCAKATYAIGEWQNIFEIAVGSFIKKFQDYIKSLNTREQLVSVVTFQNCSH